MADCSNTPTPESTANFDLDSRCFSEAMTSNADYTTARASDGNVKKTFAAALREAGQEHVGEWSTNPLVEYSNQVIPYAGTNQLFRPLSLPYQVDSATNPDPNALLPDPSTGYAGELVDVSKYASESYVDDLLNSNVITSESEITTKLNSRDSVIRQTIETNNPVSIPSNSKLTGEKSHIYTIAAKVEAVNSVTKKTNNTVTLDNQDPNTSEITVDCILYTEPAWVESEYFPQGVKVENLSLFGDAPSTVDAGYFVLQGNLNISGSIAGVKKTIWAKDIWASKIKDFKSFGAIVLERGTSTPFERVWSRGHADIQGAYRLTEFTYTEMNSCGSDGAPNGAYYFDNCQGLTLTSCGAEKASVITPDTGQYMTFGSNNLITINGGHYAPKETPDVPIVSLIGDNNRITITGVNHNVGIPYDEPDYYVKGTGNTLEIFSGKYRVTGGGVDFPKVWIEPTATDSRVFVHLKDGNRVLYKNGGAKDTPFVEYERLKGTANPRLTFGGTDSATYTVKNGYFTKDADLIVFNFEFAISARNATSGVIEIIDLPFAPVFVHSAVAASFSGASIEDGGIFLKTNVANSSIELYRTVGLETKKMTASDIADAFTITGSITYRAFSYFNE